ncbi:uncharacterized protein LOC111697995 isoform X2 [Eurytemora carolleeae]|uniref:uncharacterized protein LOC111697995 isoform X1 n=1 Tax=Eurytemora carolleeae TaxID=1294199 RepID=UPI000C766AF4|nr:uncharacterized protein LOC111697995 isoform X1 [Eurytemora carolleeae]XP_023323969.1 uncharacterized protein LOC111697995 isoform X2 [Eurytemora carolleeae]|eukprot:XP_023323968.1 uncharacterized protein LOC111697995 isoform X1 [Eurytemora affinis]
MDDSAYRGTIGGCFATTLGSVLHELGHCFDLGHTEEGIMGRGFDDLDLFFTLTEAKGRMKPRLNPCSSYQNQEINLNPLSPSSTSAPGDFSPRFTSVRRSDSISKYLEEYTQKRIRSMKNQTASGCFWTSSSSVILSRQKWMNSTPCSNIKAELPELSVVSCCELAAVEIRGEGGIVLNNWTSISPDTDIKFFAAGVKSSSTLVAVTECGNVIKQSINQWSSG